MKIDAAEKALLRTTRAISGLKNRQMRERKSSDSNPCLTASYPPDSLFVSAAGPPLPTCLHSLPPRA